MNDPAPPGWVCKRDGRLVPFEADRISRALFAATESLGRPDALLARELADSVVFFLSQDSEGGTPTTKRVAEVVEQTLRELGQGPLARAFVEHTRPADKSLAATARQWALSTLYTRDLTAAEHDGLIVLTGADTPSVLAGHVVGSPAELERAGWLAGQFVALDGLEYLVANGGSVSDLAREVVAGLMRTNLNAVVNLNIVEPPLWADNLAAGPLFADQQRRPSVQQLHDLADELFAEFVRLASPRLRIDWHCSADDFTDAARPRLLRVVQAALNGTRIGFVCDRPRRPVALAEGLDRRHPAVLLLVGVSLPALLREPGMLSDQTRYVQRLGSLVRLGLSAAVQKRDHVRAIDRQRMARGERQTVMSGFLLDRARVVMVPVGLDEVVRQLTGWGMCSGGESLELGKRLVRRLRDVLEQEARLAQMDACLDGPFGAELSRQVAGLTPWDKGASVSSQLRAAGVLHAIAQHGTLSLFIDASDAEQVVRYLEQAWRQTEVVRVRLVVFTPSPLQ